MINFSKNNSAILGSLLVCLFLALPAHTAAETDVTNNVQLNKSYLRYDLRTGTNYLTISLTNISEETLSSPLMAVIENISDPSVSVTNADGELAGKPYFEYASGSEVLSPGQTTENKKWAFSNPNRTRFVYAVSVLMNDAGAPLIGQVELPAGIAPQMLDIMAPGGTFTVGEDGTFSMPDPPQKPFLVAATVNGDTVALSFFDPEKTGNTLSCSETAVSMLMFNTLLFAVPSNLIPEALELIRGIGEVQNLGVVLCQELSQSSAAMLNPPQALTEALQAAALAVNDALLALKNQYSPINP